MITATCPHCSSPESYPDRLAGQVVDCAACFGSIHLPAPVADPLAEMAAASSPEGTIQRHRDPVAIPWAGITLAGLVIVAVLVSVAIYYARQNGERAAAPTTAPLAAAPADPPRRNSAAPPANLVPADPPPMKTPKVPTNTVADVHKVEVKGQPAGPKPDPPRNPALAATRPEPANSAKPAIPDTEGDLSTGFFGVHN